MGQIQQKRKYIVLHIPIHSNYSSPDKKHKDKLQVPFAYRMQPPHCSTCTHSVKFTVINRNATNI